MPESEPKDILWASPPKGCNNCKIRRVECDEARPECTKCVRSGRTCDGFPTAEPRMKTNDEVSDEPQYGSSSNVSTADSSRPQFSTGPINTNENNSISPSSSTPEAPILQTIQNSSPISLLANECLKIFQELGNVSPNLQLDQETIEDARARFKAWGTNIAAFRDGKLRISLDFRLSEAPGIRNTILQVLKDLKEYLHESNLILSGQKANQIWNLDDSSDSSVYSDDEDVAKEGMSRENRVISNLDEQIKGIVASNASLMKLSIIIRSSATRDDYLKAASKYNTWNPYPDIGHVREKYGHAKQSTPWLLERLGKAITKRRQFLKYRVDHNDKMTGLDDVDVTKQEKPEKTIMASTKATTFIGENAIQNVRAPVSDGGNSWTSQTSYEETNFVPEGSPRNLTVPSPPKFAFPDILFEYGEPFQCTYCFTEQVVKNRSAWKKHVFRDLKPYVCTFEECELLMMRSRNEWFAHEIQNHRREWVCQFCQHPPFSNESAFSAHTKSSHGKILANSSLKALVLQSEEPIDKIPPTACPLCDEWEASVYRTYEQLESTRPPGTESGGEAYGNLKVFRRHLGRHMEQLALFALPSNDTEQLDDDSAGEENYIPKYYNKEQMAEIDSSDEEAEEVPEQVIESGYDAEFTNHESLRDSEEESIPEGPLKRAVTEHEDLVRRAQVLQGQLQVMRLPDLVVQGDPTVGKSGIFDRVRKRFAHPKKTERFHFDPQDTETILPVYPDPLRTSEENKSPKLPMNANFDGPLVSRVDNSTTETKTFHAVLESNRHLDDHHQESYTPPEQRTFDEAGEASGGRVKENQAAIFHQANSQPISTTTTSQTTKDTQLPLEFESEPFDTPIPFVQDSSWNSSKKPAMSPVNFPSIPSAEIKNPDTNYTSEETENTTLLDAGTGNREDFSSANPDEDWTKISDLAERRRILNRIAQRNYRKKLKLRLEELEKRAGQDPETAHEQRSPGPLTQQYSPPTHSDNELMFGQGSDRENSRGPPFVKYERYPAPKDASYLPDSQFYIPPSTGAEDGKQGTSIEKGTDRNHNEQYSSELAPKRCRKPGCDKEFKRPSDLTKHEKTHSRPWKCPVESCEYHEYGWPTEKEMDRHHNDKHSSAPTLYECLYKPCPYRSTRESNCKHHMEKVHGWEYVRSSNKGRVSGLVTSLDDSKGKGKVSNVSEDDLSSNSSGGHSSIKRNQGEDKDKDKVETFTTNQVSDNDSRGKDIKEDTRHAAEPKTTKKKARPKDDIPRSGTYIIPQTIPTKPRAITPNTYPRPPSFHATKSPVGRPLSTSAWSNYPPTAPYPDYFGTGAQPIATRPLSSRFEAPPRRPSSGVGTRDPQRPSYNDVYHDDAYASASEGAVVEKGKGTSRPRRIRRSSTHEQEDYQYMPPPPRPILRQPVLKNTNEKAPDDYNVRITGESEEQPSIGPPSASRRPPSGHRNTVTYHLPDDWERPSEDNRPSTIEVANSRRRKSYYGTTSEDPFEERIRAAALYQDEVGGPNIPLTAEVLRRKQRRKARRNRSTSSSDSRDESVYTKSATTRTTATTRTSMGGTEGGDDENVTIKVTGTARVIVGGAQIECPNDGEIEIKRQRSIRNCNERSDSEYEAPIQGQQQVDGRRSRVDQTTNRARQSSQHSYTRSTQYFGGNYI